MSELGPSYALPEMRPFHQIQQQMRLVGGAVVTEHGSLSSDDYLAGVTGWMIDGEGNVEFNDGTFRGTLDGADGTFSGDLSGATISGGTIDIGGADASSFHVDSTGAMWLGAASFAGAPFKVSAAGVLTLAPTSGKRITLDSSTGEITFHGTGAGSAQIDYNQALAGLVISGQTYITSLIVTGAVMAQSNLSVFGDITANDITASGTVTGAALDSNGSLTVSGNAVIAGTLTLQSRLVSFGANDSAGAGFRQVRVPNP